jgi:RNA polymerase sigma-70 factor, ECF subfamily
LLYGGLVLQASAKGSIPASLTAQMDAGSADETALRRDHFPHACDRGGPNGNAVTVEPSSTGAGSSPRMSAGLDGASRHWVEQLRVGHPRHDQTVRSLHGVLRRVALFELSRRRHQLRSVTGPEFEDVAQQAAGDALVTVLGKLNEFRGLSRFTTWAYKFVVFEVSTKVARHAWRRQPPGVEALPADELPDPLARRPEDWLEQRAQLDALSRAIGELTDRQREVFVAIALNDVPIDVLAVKLGSNRNGIYKNLFDARRRLRARMAAAGQLVPTITATFPLEEAGAASALADLAATGQLFPLEEGGAAESGEHGPGKVVLTMVGEHQ